MQFRSGVSQLVALGMDMSCCSQDWRDVGCSVEVNSVVVHFEEKNQTEGLSSLLQGLPRQLTQHVSYTGSVVMSVEDKSGSSSLDHLKLVDISLGVWVPDWCCILYKWSHKRKVSHCLELDGVDSQVPP